MTKIKAGFLPLFICICTLLGLSAYADTPDAYRTSGYFDRGYTAYASAVPQQNGGLAVDIHLQILPGDTPFAAIDAYTLYINDAKTAEITPTGDSEADALPLHFAATVPVSEAITSMRIVPVQSGAETAAEAVDLMPVIPDGSHIGAVGVVNNPDPADRLNLRTAPDRKADSLRHYYNGVAVTILNEYPDDWVAVSIGSGTGMARGYMKSTYLAFGADAEKVTSVIPGETAVVASWTLYSLPDEASAPVAEYTAGTAFEILGESTAWWHIRVGEATGFVRAGILIEAEEEPEAPAESGEPGGSRMVIIGDDAPDASATTPPQP